MSESLEKVNILEDVDEPDRSISKLSTELGKLSLDSVEETKWTENLTGTIPDDWKKVINENSHFDKLLHELWLQKDYCVPSPKESFNWTICPLKKLRAFILGLDPKGETKDYVGTGMAFSIKADHKIPLNKVPASMKKIFRAIHGKDPLEDESYKWNLEDFSRENGVVFLNIVSTIDKRIATDKKRFEETYFKTWRNFSKELIERLTIETKHLHVIPLFKPANHPEEFLINEKYTQPKYLEEGRPGANTHPGYWEQDEIEEWSEIFKKLKQKDKLEFSRLYLKPDLVEVW